MGARLKFESRNFNVSAMDQVVVLKFRDYHLRSVPSTWKGKSYRLLSNTSSCLLSGYHEVVTVVDIST